MTKQERKDKNRKMLSDYKEGQEKRKAEIKAMPNFWGRLWASIVFWALWPWKWVWANLRDPFTLAIFVIWFLALSSEVWVSYLIGFVTWGTPASAWWLGIANVSWLWWLSPDPFSNFMIYCILLTIGTKTLFDKIKDRREERKK